MHPLPVAVEPDVFEHVLLRLLPCLAAIAVHQLALERLEEGFRERIVPWVARPRHGSGDPMGLEAALELYSSTMKPAFGDTAACRNAGGMGCA